MWPTVNQLAVVDLPKFRDERGLPVPVEFLKFVPFAVKRMFWIGDVPAGAIRGGHAHKRCHQFMICTTGRLTIEAFDGSADRKLDLTAGQAAHVKPGIYSAERYIAPETILTVLCGQEYEADDYLNDRQAIAEFRHQFSS
jgi:WxcM-like, C-terminal